MERLIEKCFGLPEDSVYSYEAVLEAEGSTGMLIGGAVCTNRGRGHQKLRFSVASVGPLPNLLAVEGVRVTELRESDLGLWDVEAILLDNSPLQISMTMVDKQYKLEETK